ncbi:hypothetical protein [Roseibium album]|uniref:hypothetical protein n=1 Tax=Roseibium album TaxID=311410 RepID=UPI00391A9440
MEQFLGFLLTFVVLGSLATAPLHLFRLASGLRLCAAAACGFLVLAQLNPEDSVARFVGGLVFVFVVAGFAGSSLFRSGLTRLLQLFNNEKFDPGGDLELPWWGHLATGLWISACVTFLIFVFLAWSTQNFPYPVGLHIGLAVLSASMVGTWWHLAQQRPTALSFLRQACLGCGLTLLLLTSYSWFHYPSVVQAAVRETIGDADYCLWNVDGQDAARLWLEFTLLTAPKRDSDAHFLLTTNNKVWEWSYFKFGFVSYHTTKNRSLIKECAEERLDGQFETMGSLQFAHKTGDSKRAILPSSLVVNAR